MAPPFSLEAGADHVESVGPWWAVVFHNANRDELTVQGNSITLGR